MKTAKAGCLVWLLGLFAAQAADTIYWLTSVAEGDYSNPANWTGGVIPTNNTIGTFSGSQTYTIHFPAGGYAENSITKVALSSGRSLTFDTRGTWWLKDAPTITNGWPNGWTGFQFANSSGQHLFNVEGLSTSYTATNYPIMCLSNALFRYYSYSATVTNVLEEGLLNLYNPGGKVNPGHSLITGSAVTRHVAVFKTNSTLRANQIRMRGNAYGNFMIFEGGDHAIYNSLQLGEGATNAKWTNTVHVAGGTLSLPASTLYIGNGKAGSVAEFSVSGEGAVSVTNNIVMANQSLSSCSLLLGDSAVLHAGTYLDAASASSSTSTVALAGGARLSVGGNLSVARGTGSFATLDLRDQSACTAGGYLLIGGYSGSDGTVSVRDGATLTVANTVEAGASGGTGRLELLGGRLVARNVRGGAGGWSEFVADGGTLCASNSTASTNLLVNFAQAELGAAGLTLDSAGYDATVGQAFADAAGADGLFLKTGAGTLSVSNSAHALTVVAQGGLRVLDAAATFGRSLVVTNGASLSLVGAAATLTAGDLTLGTAGQMAALYLDAGDSVTVTNSTGLTVNSCGIHFGNSGANGVYTLFRSTAAAIDGAAANNLTLLNPVAGKSYVFAVVPDGSDSTLQLSVGDLTLSDALWDGSESADWNTADNWTPAALPTAVTRARFTESGAQKTVGISAPATASILDFDSASPYTLQGAQLSLPAGGISNSLGSHTIDAPLALAGSLAVLTASASTTTVSGAISGSTGTALSKSGSGTLVVAGDNAAFDGLWHSSGGRLRIASASGLGVGNAATNALVLGAGTFSYSGAPATLTRGLTLSAGSSSNAVIFEALSNLTLNTTLSLRPSLFCKRGPAALTLAVGSGTTALSVGSGSGGVNINPVGAIVLPDTGDAPAFPTGLAGFNVIEGLLRLKGAGSAVSTVNQQHVGVIGGQYDASQADPVLELDAVRMVQGGAGLHLLLGNQMSASSSARTPTLRMVNGAILTLDHFRMGVNPATTFSPTLIMSNSTLTTSFQISVGADNNTAPVLRLMQGSTALSTGNNQWGGGIALARNVDILVAENSVLGQTGTGNNNFFRFSDAYSSGTLRFESGGTLRFAKFMGLNASTANGLNVYFNGGVMEPVASLLSYSTAADKQSFIIEEGGLTVKVGSGIRHALHFPLTGTGALIKTGAGELVFGHGVAYTTAGATNSLGLPTTATGLATGDHTGGTAVQEGTLSVSNGTSRSDAVIAISAGAMLNLSGGAVTLGEVSGSGTVSNGVLTAGYRCHVTESGNDLLAFADVTLPAGLTVTFDLADGCALTNRQVLAVATRSGSSDLNLPAWRAANVGEKLTADFTLVNHTVYAAVRSFGGTLITVR
jgi:hypothetical protein